MPEPPKPPALARAPPKPNSTSTSGPSPTSTSTSTPSCNAGVTLRTLTPSDWRLWRALRLAALRDSPSAFGSSLDDWIDAPEERWSARLSIPGARDLVAFVDGEAVGMATGVPATWTAPTAVSCSVPPVSASGSGEDEDGKPTPLGPPSVPVQTDGDAPRDAAVEIISMWVSSTARSRGVANALIRAIADWARGEGRTDVVLNVVESNAVAIRAYERAGLSVVGRGEEKGEVLMRMRL